MEDFLFPLLHDTDTQTMDWWSIRSFTHLRQRTEAMLWLTEHGIGVNHWITYVVMHDFLDIKVIQHLYKKKISLVDMQSRIVTFFFQTPKKIKISTIPLKINLHHL